MIARRIIQIGAHADVGAMFLRHMLWKLKERPGTAPHAAVIFEALFTRGVRYIAAAAIPCACALIWKRVSAWSGGIGQDDCPIDADSWRQTQRPTDRPGESSVRERSLLATGEIFRYHRR